MSKIIISGMDTENYRSTQMVNKLRHAQIMERFAEYNPVSVVAHYKGDEHARAIMIDTHLKADAHVELLEKCTEVALDFSQEYFLEYYVHSKVLIEWTSIEWPPIATNSDGDIVTIKISDDLVVSWVENGITYYLEAKNYV